ncbi:DUF5448 family protein [Lelliottia wanjuensis]|uniref:DUF5448 family protein n=1 Tax=Lelliottia wanjuensis TaxID=3050585 RepID=A0AAP4LC86_9ENTR|nr:MULTISPECIES: DUF5448 family protein [unclassified Lelliottia]MDK9365357.1 DUF5448 family protein [Lelliottia sp. V106_12]MDK9585797.1 DUF5448 family protein [Lelliottia sp. V86_10]MDK9617890.1 DUF5448 family protein [Lelliottia sp. V106_9]
MDYSSMTKHELADMRNAIEREQKRREAEPKVITYRVTSCMTEHRYFKDLKCALLCLKETAGLVIESSLEDGGEYVNKCTGIVGVVFRVEEVAQSDFDAWEKEKRYDDICFQDRVGELVDA